MSVENLSKVVVDNGEEMLKREIPPMAVNSNITASFYVGIDCGSTQTRSVLTPRRMTEQEDGKIEDWFKMYLAIPSISKVVPEAAQLKQRSGLLYDGLDAVSSFNGESEIRLARGSKFYDVESVQKELVASVKKINSEAILYNIADSIGYNIVLHHAEHNKPIPGRIEIKLSVALPPDDLLGKELNIFKNKLQKFSWMMKDRMNGPIEVTVLDIVTYSEPQAQLQAYFALSSDTELPEEVLLLESGGRNSAPVIFLNGAPVGAGLKSIEQSGSLLLDKVSMAYMEEYGGKAPSRRLLEHAIRTGQMKYGNVYRNIVDIIKRCKDEMAEDLFQKLQSDILSKQSAVSLESLNLILLSGRVYQAGDYNYSVAERLQVLIKAASPATEVQIVEKNCIPQGLVLLYLLDVVYAE